MKKSIIYILSCLICLLNLSALEVFAENRKTDTLEILSKVNDNKVKNVVEKLSEMEKLKSDRILLKITDSLNGEFKRTVEQKSKIDFMLNEDNPNYAPREVVESWLALDFDIYGKNSLTTNELFIVGRFEWLKKPMYQLTDFFGVGVDSELLFADQRDFDEITMSYFPDKNNYNVSKTYNGRDDVEKIKTNDKRFLAIEFPIIPEELMADMINHDMLEVTNPRLHDLYYNSYGLKRMPMGIITMPLERMSSTSRKTNLVLNYGHQVIKTYVDIPIELNQELKFEIPTIYNKAVYESGYYPLAYEFGTNQ